jgi:NAD(P)H-hydrate repair Nnr-like enzyme with NAD(P)H-hydrate dehydratase domain
VVFSPGRVQAHLFGSGWGDRADGAEVLAQVAEQGLPAVVDADGLRYLPRPAPAGWLLTPHAGELATLLERERSWVEQDPVRAVTAGAEQTGATVLLKGATQLVAAPTGGPVLVAVPGPAWTAQAGSGDVLGGVCAALLAAGVDAQRAGQLGASVQAVAAAQHPGVLAPQELARAIGQALGRLEQRARTR